MLDLARLSRLRLNRQPKGQKFVAYAYLMPNFAFLPGVDIRFEGLENLPDEPVVFAMNHTDRYNYWPFQYTLWRKTGRFTATWVKGKYFEGKVTSAFLEMTNNIPAASRGYLITRDFVATMKRPPSDEEYKTLRHWVDAVSKSRLPGATANDIRPDGPLPEALLATPRDMMGRPFDPTREDYAHAIDELFREMTRLFIDANRRALETGLDVILCVGETIEERKDGRTEEVVRRQLAGGLKEVAAPRMEHVTIAYEPVWAIGTGLNATPEQAGEVHDYLRGLLAGLYTESVAAGVRIQYGGSVKPDNVGRLMAVENVDGALVGGASLTPEKFLPIIEFDR